MTAGIAGQLVVVFVVSFVLAFGALSRLAQLFGRKDFDSDAAALGMR